MNYKVGDTIDEFRLVCECGQGSYGIVFIAENQQTTGRVALKIVYKHGNKPERELKGLRQYQIISENTNLLQIYKVKDSEDFFYYTMDAADNLDPNGEYVPDTLGNRLKSGRMKPAALRKMFEELQENLQVLHGKGLFHRDIKPDNILFINNRARLGDIGLVTNSATTTLRGTPGFMPTEVLAGLRSYEASDDYYALGKIVYCALTGRGVNSYPSFPASCTLTSSGDLIKLYNKYCSPCDPQTGGSYPRRSYFKWAACGAVLLLIAAAVFVLYGSKSAPKPSTGKAPTTQSVSAAAAKPQKKTTPAAPAKPRTVPAEQKENPQLTLLRMKSNEQLQKLLQIYIPEQDIMLIYPELQKTYAETILPKRSKNIPLSRDEQLLAEYIENENALTELLGNIKLAIDSQGSFSDKDAAKLAQLQDQRRNLEENLIKKYQK